MWSGGLGRTRRLGKLLTLQCQVIQVKRSSSVSKFASCPRGTGNSIQNVALSDTGPFSFCFIGSPFLEFKSEESRH
jgi:hypothetical protein